MTPYLAKSILAEAGATIRRRALNRSNGVKQDDSAELKRFSKALRYLRKMADMSQLELGKKCGCTIANISNIERGANWPSLSLHDGICRELGVGV